MKSLLATSLMVAMGTFSALSANNIAHAKDVEPANLTGTQIAACGYNVSYGLPSHFQATARGVPSALIERLTPLTVDRLEPMANGGVMATYSTAFRPDEVLTINKNNNPVLMTMKANGALVPHPTQVAAVHQNEILLVNRSINLNDLKDNPFPTSTYSESSTLGQHQVAYPSVTSFNTPLSAADFNRSLLGATNLTAAEINPHPGESFVAYNAQGSPVVLGTIIATQPTRVIPGETPVSFYSALPAGWRGIRVSNGAILLLDQRGVIQGIIPASSNQ